MYVFRQICASWCKRSPRKTASCWWTLLKLSEAGLAADEPGQAQIPGFGWRQLKPGSPRD